MIAASTVRARFGRVIIHQEHICIQQWIRAGRIALIQLPISRAPSQSIIRAPRPGREGLSPAAPDRQSSGGAAVVRLGAGRKSTARPVARYSNASRAHNRKWIVLQARHGALWPHGRSSRAGARLFLERCGDSSAEPKVRNERRIRLRHHRSRQRRLRAGRASFRRWPVPAC